MPPDLAFASLQIFKYFSRICTLLGKEHARVSNSTICFVKIVLFIGLIVSTSVVSADENESQEAIARNLSPTAALYRSPQERREAGLGTQLTDWLKISGLVEAEKGYDRLNLENSATESHGTPASQALQIVLSANADEWFEAELVYTLEYDGGEKENRLEEGFIGIESDEWGMKFGRMAAPFGEYYSHFLTGPMLEFSETLRESLIIEYSPTDALQFSYFLLSSKVHRVSSNNKWDWGVSVEYANDGESVRAGAGYLSDLAESEEDFLRDTQNQYQQRVSAWNAYLLLGLYPYELTTEIVRALAGFSEFGDNADQPVAYNVEAAYSPTRTLQIALRHERSEELQNMPQKQYGLSATWLPHKHMSLSAEYLLADFKNGFVVDKNNSVIVDRDRVTFGIAIEF